MRGKRETPSERAFAAKHCDNPRAIAKYLNDALATGDSVLITKAIGDMVRAQGVTRVSRRAHNLAVASHFCRRFGCHQPYRDWSVS
jgi:DNA-binding phage protein